MDSFSFKQFTIQQDKTAMKVGTDGVLLGAWAQGGKSILDVGCGTGVISLIMAQRFPHAEIVGIDIEKSACEQAFENVKNSLFASRIKIFNKTLQSFGKEGDLFFDTIVCNPPFFVNSLVSPDEQRSTARHANTLTLSDVFRGAARLLKKDGNLSLVLPFDQLRKARDEAAIFGLFECRCCIVRTTPKKTPKRVLVAFSKNKPTEVEMCEECLLSQDGTRSSWYQRLTEDFYIR